MYEDQIAIIGAACRLPGAQNLSEFWTLLSSGRDAVTEIPDNRWSKDFYFHPNPAERGKAYTWAAGVIDKVGEFDAGYFGISPREADQIDPQQRLLLELTAEALQDAGIPASRMAGSKCGVYVGASSGDYGDIRMGDPASGDAYFMTGVTASIIANRVSYVFDLHGPSFAVDTACSSSLVALDLACKAIREGRVPTALVGGVSLLLSPYPFIGFCRASMLSPAGRCFAFDARASGYVRAEGGGVVLLKPLKDALADGDNIRGVILGTGVNSDGRTVGLSLPNGAAQAALLNSVYGENGIDPERLSFVEAHGTGTQAGDPIELGALGDALAQRRSRPLPIGSVKTNIGHLEAGSGMAGLIKAMLALDKRVVPPSLHFETPNPAIPFDELNLSVVTKPTVLPEGEQLLAGVNSFGFGGTNGHVILASPPKVAKPTQAAAGTSLPPLLISARSEAALKTLAGEWSILLAESSDAGNARAIRAAARHRDQHKHRLVVSGATAFDMAESLDAFAATGHAPGAVGGAALPSGKLAFVFSGNGVQKPGMARDAMQYSSAFSQAIAELDTYLEPLLGWSVAKRLLEDNDPDLMARTDIAQPLLFAVQVGVVSALRELGVEPAAYTGHSVGEIAAGWAAGALTLADACKIIVVRSQQQQRTEGAGSMAALGLPAEKAAEVLAKLGGGLEIAAINSSQGVTVAGPKPCLARLEAMATAEEWRFTRLNLNYAFHSAALDPIQDDLIAALDGIEPRDCGTRFVSTVTGAPADGRTLDAQYWWRNIRDPVQFKPAIDHLIADGTRIFMEIGPNPALMSYLRDGLKVAEATGRTFGSLSHAGGTRDPFPLIAGECHVSGYDLSASPIFDGPADFRGLPAYPWQREEYWFQPTNDGFLLHTPRRDHALLGFQRSPPNPVWSNVLSTEKQPWLLDHVVEGVPVVPGAALVEIALAAAKVTYPDAQCLEVTGVEIPRALVVEPGHSRELKVVLEEDGQLRIATRSRLSEEPWGLHAVARVAQGSAHVPAAFPEASIARTVDAAALYATASRLGLDYGPHFQTVQRVEIIDDHEAVVALAAADSTGAGEYLIDPALLDGALQGLFALLVNRVEIGPGESFMPARFGRIRLFAPYHRAVASARIAIRRAGVRSVSAALTLFDVDGGRIADIDDCWFQRVKLNRQADLASQLFRFEPIAVPSPADSASPTIDIAAALAVAALPAAGIQDGGDITLLFDAFLASSAYGAVKQVVAADSPFKIPDLVLSGVVAREAAPLMGWLLLLLARHGLATEGDGGWSLSAEAGLPEPDVLWRTLIADAPELTAELALAGSADLQGMLRTGFDGVKLSAPLVDQMLYGSPPGEQTLSALSDAVMAIADDWPAGRPLRILEVGAGSGALTRRLLNRLTHWCGTLKYVASDRDAHMAQRLSLITSDYVAASAQQWNPAEGGFVGEGYAGPFDLVVSMYGLTRAEMHGGSTQRFNAVLAPGGYLLTAEPEQNEAWNAVFGQSAEWWAGSLDSDFPMSPIAGGATLRDQLIQSGLSPLPTTSIGKGLWPVTLIAARRDPATGGDVAEIQAGGRIVLVTAGNNPVAPMLAERLTAMGIPATVIDPPHAADGANLLAVLAAPGEQPPQVVCLASLHKGELSASDAASRMADVLTVARLAAETGEHTALWIVTANAHGENGGDSAEAGLWGFGRTIRNELSQLDCRLVDLPSRWSPQEVADTLAMEIALPDAEREIVWNSAGRHALRLRRGFSRAEAVAQASALTIGHPGLIDTLHWTATEKRKPGPGQVRIAVKASGLNFRDVMWAMALLPEEALMDGFSGPTLGLECTGTIDAVGKGVTGFKVGDRVMALAPAALQSHVVTEAHAVAPLPDSMGFAAGASIPVTYLTVLYSLSTQARLEAGEWILIHGGAGGVGLAAIQYAKHVGATIVATAGSPTKRAFLKHLGVDHVLDSRDLTFADAVRELTGGRGVDVVLNSLGGEAMERSLGLLKPFGRFVELGKRDFMMDTRVGLRALRQNVSYYAVDVDRLPVERPELAAKLLKEVSDLMASGALHPLPYRTFPFSEVSDAFRLMQGAGHLGKIVLVPDGSPIPLPLTPAEFVKSEGVYLITGGLSGFGLETARWLAAKGARQLALVGRRKASDAPEAGAALEAFAAQGVDARTFQCDVGDEAAVAAMLADIRTNLGPIRGIVHAAMVVDDGLVGNLTAERITGVLAPKVDGAHNLDRLTRNDPVDLFLLYSSATTVMGAPGQGSYVAANMGLEAIAKQRKAEGLPALAVAWGPIGDVGYLARHDAANDALMRRLGTTPIPATTALDALPLLLASGEATIAFAPVRWDAAHQYLPILKTPTFEDVASGGSEVGGGDLRDRIHAMSPAEAKEFITGLLIEEAARVMSFAPDRIDAQRPLSEFGMDSLMAVELRLALETRLGIDVPLVSLSDTTTLSTIAARIVRNLSKGDTGDGGLIDTMIRHEADAAHETLDKAQQSFGGHPEHAAAAE
jgi:acyl transferase domain-containing protein/acyl carrier protein